MAQPDSSDDEEGAHEHDVREQEELLFAANANLGRGTSTDLLVLSEWPPPPRPATAPGAHDAGLEYGANAADIAAENMAAIIADLEDDGPKAMTTALKRKQPIFAPSPNRCPACRRIMFTLLSTGADRCKNQKCPVSRGITGGGERSAKKAARDSAEAAPLMVDREQRPAAAAAQRQVAAWVNEALGARASNGHIFAIGAIVELRQNGS